MRLGNATLASFYRGSHKEQRCLTDEHMQIVLAAPLLHEHLQGKPPQFLWCSVLCCTGTSLWRAHKSWCWRWRNTARCRNLVICAKSNQPCFLVIWPEFPNTLGMIVAEIQLQRLHLSPEAEERKRIYMYLPGNSCVSSVLYPSGCAITHIISRTVSDCFQGFDWF